MTDSCVFCRIVRGELPSTQVYEDETILAFLDIAPIIPGHTLVIPKAHYESLAEVPEACLGPLLRVAQKILLAQLRGLGAHGVNIFQANGSAAGQVVPHVHLHVIPRYREDGYRWNWASRSYSDPAEPARLAENIRRALSET